MKKILYVAPRDTKKDLYTNDEIKPSYDFNHISKTIIEGILSNVSGIEITQLKDFGDAKVRITTEHLNKYDAFICDLTTMNPNVLYNIGQADSLGKPVIYIKSHTAIYPARLVDENIITYSDASIENDFIEALSNFIKTASKNPSSLINNASPIKKKKKAFISYSHQNREYLDRLMVHLKPLSNKGLLDIWVDTEIKTGDQWKTEIEKALEESSISILLVSADFMASDFIVNDELPPLLSKAEVNGTKILPVIISPCRFSREPSLNRFQAANPPNKPLSALSEGEKETIYDKLAHDIELALENS